MNAGIIAMLMHQFPYQFPGLPVLSTIAWMIDFVWFIIASLIFLLRLAWFRREAYEELTNDMSTLAMLACWPISWMTLVAFVSLTVSDAYWGGHAFTLVAYVMWWIGAGWTLATLFFVFCVLISRRLPAQNPLPTLIVIPAVAVATLGAIGGLICSYSSGISGRLAVPVIIFSFFGVGMGIFMAIFLYAYLLHQQLTLGWPPPGKSIVIFLYIGPMGQSSAALQTLGSAAMTFGRFAEYHRGSFLTRIAAAPLNVACVLMAMLMSGMAVGWIVLAFCALIREMLRRELRWSPEWNSIIFPTGTLTTSFLLFGVAMNSPFFKVMTGILLVFLLIIFFVNLAFTIWEVARGRLLIVREDYRVKRPMEEEQKGR